MCDVECSTMLNMTFQLFLHSPQAAEAVQHGDDGIVGECVPKPEVRLQEVLRQVDGDAQEPGEDAQRPGEWVEIRKDNRRAGGLEELVLIVGPHILEDGHLGAVAPAGHREQKVGEEQADEDHIVDGLVEALVRAGDELLHPLAEDQHHDGCLAAVDEDGPHDLLGAPGVARAGKVLLGRIAVDGHHAHYLEEHQEALGGLVKGIVLVQLQGIVHGLLLAHIHLLHGIATGHQLQLLPVAHLVLQELALVGIQHGHHLRRRRQAATHCPKRHTCSEIGESPARSLSPTFYSSQQQALLLTFD